MNKPKEKKREWEELDYNERRKFALQNGINPTGVWQPTAESIYELKCQN